MSAISINRLIRRVGVKWHDCEGCGRTWPFPVGFQADHREWRCHVCVNALLAQCQRTQQGRGSTDADSN